MKKIANWQGLILGIFITYFLSWFTWCIVVGHDRSMARKTIGAAIERMQQVEDVNDAHALLQACESTMWDKIECGLANYPITYRGHHVPFSLIKITYYRGLQRLPYAAATVYIERRPQIKLVRYEF